MTFPSSLSTQRSRPTSPDMARERIPSWWTDTGCYVSSSCFTCPLEECVYVTGDTPITLRTKARALEARRLQGEGVPNPEIAARLGVSLRSLYRLLRS